MLPCSPASDLYDAQLAAQYAYSATAFQAAIRNAGVPSYGVAPLFAKTNDTFAHGLDERLLAAEVPASLGYWHDLLTRLTK